MPEVVRVQYQQLFEPLIDFTSAEGDDTGEIARWGQPTNEPIFRKLRRPHLLPASIGILTTSPEDPGVPSEASAVDWMQPTNQPYRTRIRHPELLPPTGTLVINPALYTEYVDETAGPSALFIEKPDGVAVAGLAGPIENVLAWETHRYLNRVGSWSAHIPVGDQLVNDVPLSQLIKRGWVASIVQENNRPLHRLDLEYLLYRGIIEDKKYDIDESGQPVCELTGSFRSLALSARSTPTKVAYTSRAASSIGTDVEGGIAGGVTAPANGGASVSVTFGGSDGDGVISRYARLLELGALARWGLREGWVNDQLEYVQLDNPPNSTYVLLNQEAADPSQSQAGQQGFALIGGTPEVRTDGHGVVNRIVAFGADFDDSPLTLQYATNTVPYTVQVGTNPDGTKYYYLEDGASIDRYGLVEMVVHRSDIKNPSNTLATRQAAADVLHAFASGELIKHRSPKVYVAMPVANGSQVWALPGDKIKLQYTGWVELDAGRVTWMEFDQWFLVTERHDKADASGARQVEFVLAAPEVEITLPSLPDAVVLPITDGGGLGPAPGAPGGYGSPGGGGSSAAKPPGGSKPLPDCCDDKTVTVPGIASDGNVTTSPPGVAPPPFADSESSCVFTPRNAHPFRVLNSEWSTIGAIRAIEFRLDLASVGEPAEGIVLAVGGPPSVLTSTVATNSFVMDQNACQFWVPNLVITFSGAASTDYGALPTLTELTNAGGYICVGQPGLVNGLTLFRPLHRPVQWEFWCDYPNWLVNIGPCNNF